MLRSRLPRISLSRVLTRKVHNVPPIKEELREGIPGFLSRKAIDCAWYDYQQFLVNRLNRIVVGQPDEPLDTKNLLIRYARQPEGAILFNYASMAHNNQFFFDSLAVEETQMTEKLENELIASFSSIETLQKSIVNTANGMFGPGFVWLVQRNSEFSTPSNDSSATYAILTTYHAGSPYPGAHWRLQSLDMNTQDEASVVNQVGSHGALSQPKDAKHLLGGFNRQDAIVPLLCINTWEHVYLHEYGFAGKRKYANNWWKRIDWEVVESRRLAK